MERQKTPGSQSLPEKKKDNPGETTIPDFRLHYRAIVIKHWSFNIQNCGFQE